MPQYRVEREVRISRTYYSSVEADSYEEAQEAAAWNWDDYDDWDEDEADSSVTCEDCGDEWDGYEEHCSCNNHKAADEEFFDSIGV